MTKDMKIAALYKALAETQAALRMAIIRMKGDTTDAKAPESIEFYEKLCNEAWATLLVYR